MTTFAEYLVAASSLSSGTVWDLITHPRTGGSGVVVNNGAFATIDDNNLFVAIDDNNTIATITDNHISCSISDNKMAMAIAITPGTTVKIITQPIGATA